MNCPFDREQGASTHPAISSPKFSGATFLMKVVADLKLICASIHFTQPSDNSQKNIDKLQYIRTEHVHRVPLFGSINTRYTRFRWPTIIIGLECHTTLLTALGPSG